MPDERPKELCCECQAETGRAGKSEDSLYIEMQKGDRGPLCESCHEKWKAIVGRVYVRFDGPPAHESGRFIEVERDGASISFGMWLQDGNDWLLVLPDGAPIEWIATCPAFRGLWRSRCMEDTGIEIGWSVTFIKDGEYTETPYQETAAGAISKAQVLLGQAATADPAKPTEISIDTIRLNHFIVNTCRFQIDMATGETHCRDQIYKTLREAIDADMGASTADSEKSYECVACGTAIDSETVDRNLERCDPCAAAGKTDETGYPDADAIAEDKREREADAVQPSTRPHQEIDRLATFIQSLDCGEPSQSQGAVDTAIRMIGTIRDRMAHLDRQSLDLYPGKRMLAGRIVYFLNALAEDDREAIREVFDTRISCNVKLAEHSSVQVRMDSDGWKFGILGILNGFVGTDVEGNGLIQRIVDDEDPKRIEFCVAPE